MGLSFHKTHPIWQSCIIHSHFDFVLQWNQVNFPIPGFFLFTLNSSVCILTVLFDVVCHLDKKISKQAGKSSLLKLSRTIPQHCQVCSSHQNCQYLHASCYLHHCWKWSFLDNFIKIEIIQFDCSKIFKNLFPFVHHLKIMLYFAYFCKWHKKTGNKKESSCE